MDFFRFEINLFGKKIIKGVFPILNKYNIKAFLYGGTLLGYIREKGFIKHDDDLDLGIFEKDIPKMQLLKKELLQKGWKVKGDTKEMIVFEKPEFYYLNIDFYYFIKTDNKYIVYPYHKYDLLLYNSLIKVNFLDILLNIPKNYISCLKEDYGKSWNKSIYVSQNKRNFAAKLREKYWGDN